MANEDAKIRKAIARKKVVANALEVYIALLRGANSTAAMATRPYKKTITYALDDEEDIACELSIDRDVCAQGAE